MPRQPCVAPGDQVYQVINRANGRLRLFRKDEDFLAFYRAMHQTYGRTPARLLAWSVMGNHWRFVVRPHQDGELSRFFGYLALTHARRLHTAHDAIGTGHVYQSRFKSFLIQRDTHLAWILRYVDRNPQRAGLVNRAQDWRWGSLHARLNGPDEIKSLLSDLPMAMPADWAEQVNRPQAAAEEEAVQLGIRRDPPLGDERRVRDVARWHPPRSSSKTSSDFRQAACWLSLISPR